MHLDLPNEGEPIRRSARELTDAELVERVRENDCDGRFDTQLAARPADRGNAVP
jgi:hypothetical protein